MNCRKCNIENSDQAKYCKNCGQILREDNQQTIKTIKHDKLIIWFLVVVFGVTVFSVVHKQFYHNWFESPLKYVQLGMWMIMELSFLLLPFSLQNKNLKIACIIMIALRCLYTISEQWVFFQI